MKTPNENETFKLEVSTMTKTFKEISLPHYRKTKCFAYKIFSETNCIQVCYVQNSHAIGVYSAELAFAPDAGSECTAEEFTTLYNLVSEKLNSL